MEQLKTPELSELVKQQHPQIDGHILALPQYFAYDISYRNVIKMVLSQDARIYLKELDGAKFSVRPVTFGDGTRHAVPIIIFRKAEEMRAFMYHWQ